MHCGRTLSRYRLLIGKNWQIWKDQRKILLPCDFTLDWLTTQVSHCRFRWRSMDAGEAKTRTVEQGRAKVKGRELQTPQTTAGESGNVRGVSQQHATPILSPRLQAEGVSIEDLVPVGCFRITVTWCRSYNVKMRICCCCSKRKKDMLVFDSMMFNRYLFEFESFFFKSQSIFV